MFDIERFIEDCAAAVAEHPSQKAVREVVARAVSEPGEVAAAFGEPTGVGLAPLYRSDTLTILNVIWSPHMTLRPHTHNGWALIGIYSGREDNIFWRRTGDRIEAAGAEDLAAGDVGTLGPNIIHSVTNPIGKLTCALHVYGGDFFAPGRSEWDPETLAERPFDFERAQQAFAEANARFSSAR